MRKSRLVTVVSAGVILAAAAGFAVRAPSAAAGANEPLPGPATTTVNPDGSIHHEVELVASDVDLTHRGVHTHANWVVFELPFDVEHPSIKHVRFAPRATTETAIGALHTRFGCARMPSLGPVTSERITKFTKNGIGYTLPFGDHGLAPTTSPRAYAINVPTRLANAAACWRPQLLQRETWRLRVAWDSD